MENSKQQVKKHGSELHIHRILPHCLCNRTHETDFFGDITVFPAIIDSTFESAKTAFEISIGLTGALSLWLGIMKIGEKGGVVNVLARLLSPVFCRLFPDVPKGHPVTGTIFMNIAANMLGLDNAATPMGLKAMGELQAMNKKKDTATNPMIMFLVLNTSGLTLIPVSIMVYRAQLGAANPSDVFIPLLLATFFSTLTGIIVTSMFQKINLINRTMLSALGIMCLAVSAIIWGFSMMDRETMEIVSRTAANVILMSIICTFIVAGMRKRINVYDVFIEGAKEGFKTAVTIIPYLVAILVGIGVFRASGGMDWLIGGISWTIEAVGGSTEFVGALPTAIMKPPLRQRCAWHDGRCDDTVWRGFLRRQAGKYLPRFYGHYLLHPCSLFRQCGNTQDPPRCHLRSRRRPCGNHCRNHHLLHVLRIVS